jgi:hypothetical protein
MRVSPRLHFPLRAAALTLAALGLAVPLSADDPPQKKSVNKLHGVVVSKKDGKPLSAIRVAMAHAEKGYVMFERGAQLRTSGPEEKILWFLAKRNGKTACEDTTDAEGRFTFRSFTSPGGKYNFVAAHPEHGVALLTGLVPEQYQDKPLRIELDEPGFITTGLKPPASSEQAWERVDVALAPDPGTPDEVLRVYFNVLDFVASAPEGDQERHDYRLGPLPGGRKYRLRRHMYLRAPGYSATLFERHAFVKSGETVEFPVRRNEGAIVSGRVTDSDDKPLVDVNVTVSTRDESGVVIGAVTDRDGNYTLTGVPVGTHALELLRHAPRTTPG